VFPALSVACDEAPWFVPVVLNVLDAGVGPEATPDPALASASAGSFALQSNVTLSLYQSVPPALIGVAAVLAVTFGAVLSMFTAGVLVAFVKFPALS